MSAFSRGRLASRRMAAALPQQRRWAQAQAVTVFLFSPWLLVAWHTLRTYHSSVHGGSIGWMLEQTAIVFSLGHSVLGLAVVPGTADFPQQEALARRLLLPFLVAFVVGLVALRRHLPLLLVWLLLPTAGILALALREHGFDPRYLIGSAPAFALLVAAGLAASWRTRRRRLIGIPLALAIAGSTTVALIHLYADPVYARDDNRAVVQELGQEAAPGAAVILDAGFRPAFAYYAHERWPVLALPSPLPADPAATARLLSAFSAGRGQVWLVLWHDYYADPRRL